MNQAKPKIRLYVPEPYVAGQQLVLPESQSHYLRYVMRLKEGEALALFNGEDGVWRAEIAILSKKSITVQLIANIEKQKASPDLWLAFAPIKGKTELVVEKAVELGVSALLPVFTQHSVVKSINHDKLTAHAMEAAEQSERHDVPRLQDYKDLSFLLAAWPADRTLLFADESGSGTSLKTLLPSLPVGKYGLLVGPEGGFSSDERAMLKLGKNVKPFGLGPRILRADTATVAALACIQAWLGDWETQPKYEPQNGTL